MKWFPSKRLPDDKRFLPHRVLKALQRIATAMEADPPSDPRIVSLQANVDRLEAGFLNWKQEMTRLAARIEKQTWRREQQLDKPEPEETGSDIIDATTERVRARRRDRGLPGQRTG